MQINVEQTNGISVFKVDGDIDINTAPDLKKFCDRNISKEKNKVVIDLSSVGYVDSSGLATLVEILKNLRSYSGKLKLASLSAKVKGLFEITKLDKLFDISPDLDTALETF